MSSMPEAETALSLRDLQRHPRDPAGDLTLGLRNPSFDLASSPGFLYNKPVEKHPC